MIAPCPLQGPRRRQATKHRNAEIPSRRADNTIDFFVVVFGSERGQTWRFQRPESGRQSSPPPPPAAHGTGSSTPVCEGKASDCPGRPRAAGTSRRSPDSTAATSDGSPPAHPARHARSRPNEYGCNQYPRTRRNPPSLHAVLPGHPGSAPGRPLGVGSGRRPRRINRLRRVRIEVQNADRSASR